MRLNSKEEAGYKYLMELLRLSSCLLLEVRKVSDLLDHDEAV